MARGVSNQPLQLQGHSKRFALFGLVGVLNTGLDFLVYAVAVFGGLPPAVSNLLAFAAANPFSYFVNSRLTFRRKGRPAPVSFAAYGKFLSAHLFSLTLATAMVFLLSSKIGPFAAKLVAVIVTVFVNYLASVVFVFPHDGGSESEPRESA